MEKADPGKRTPEKTDGSTPEGTTKPDEVITMLEKAKKGEF
jgi:hypothetical protein